MSVLLTRPQADSARIAAMLAEDGIASLIWPLTEIVFTDSAAPVGVSAFAFSSRNAVHGYARLTQDRTGTVFCVGGRTAETAREAGFADVRDADGNFEALVDLILTAGPDTLHYLRGEDVSGDLPAALSPHGIRCTQQVVYAARPAPPPAPDVEAALAAGAIRAVTVWSRRNALLLGESISAHPGWKIAQADLIAISENAVGNLGMTGFRRNIIASRPNATHMIAEIRAALRYGLTQ